MSARSCFYCQAERARTREHIFGSQFVKVLAEDPNCELPTETRVALRGGPILRTFIGKFTKKGHPTIEFICKVGGRCNSEWMSRVDDRAASVIAPMIRGHETVIDSEMRQRVAAWAIKTALSGRSVNEPPQVIEQEWANALRTTELPIPNWYVWIGVWHGNPSHFFNSLDDSIHRAEIMNGGMKGLGLVSAHSVNVSFVIGYLAVQVFGLTGDGPLGIDANPDALLTIWPNDSEPVTWPPKLAISSETVWDCVFRLRPSPAGE